VVVIERNTQYMVKLKYIKPIKLPIVREQKLAEFIPIVPLEDDKYIKGKIEGTARVFLPEFINFAKHLGFEVSGKKRITLKTDDDYAYLRLFVYAMVMQSLRDKTTWGKLEDCIISMDALSLRYWASTFRNKYWKYKNRRKLLKIAKYFLEIEEI
jgi:hypothetical protein